MKLQFTLAELKFWLPLPPALLLQETRVTPTLSVALPLTVTVALAVENADALVGTVMLTEGLVVSEPPAGGGDDGVVGTVEPDSVETLAPPHATKNNAALAMTMATGTKRRIGR